MAVRSRKKGFFRILSRTLAALWRHKFWVLFLVIITVAFTAWQNAKNTEHSASARLFLRYEQAYEGLNPNGTRFNINELLGDEVLSTAIDRAGLTGILSYSDLLDSIAVSASGSQSPSNMYIATEYMIQLRDTYLPRQISARSMLLLLMEVYREYFLDHYGSNDSALNINWSDASNWEYLEFADVMNARISNLIAYLDSLQEESGLYQYHTTAESFRSLSESVSNFRDIYLNKYTSYVTMNKLTRTPDRFLSKLKYRRFLAQQDLKFHKDYYQIYQDSLDLYDESMITFVMVPMYDTSNGLYMARTSIGMDSLTEESKGYADSMELDAKNLKVFDQQIEEISAPGSDRSQYEYAEQMIFEIEEHLNSLIQRIRIAKKNYEDYRSKNSIQFRISGYSLFSGYGVTKALLFGVVVIFLCGGVYAALEIRKQEKLA